MRTPQRATLRSQWLGQQLRELRDECQLKIKEVAEYLQRDPGTVSRFESGFYPIRRPDLMALLDLYGVSDPQRREALLQLSQDVWQKGWWDGYVLDVAGSMIDFVWLEARAARIRSFAVVVTPGLLQTPAYAERVLRINEPDATPDQLERWLELRMTRQQVLKGDEPTRLSVILDEAILHREIGGPEIMAGQLHHLAECASRPNIDVRILPFRTGTPASTYGSFEVIELPAPFPDVAYSETLAGALYVEPPDTDRFLQAYDGHERRTLGPAESTELISATAEKWQ